ncbi:MAG: hypothetical protein QM779_10150 [Propionicimonas sp.]|uniref:hypothetical protein n=1 Tax=Propionicimonas sp. TaxID=1955623 RepID=UPI003D0C537D
MLAVLAGLAASLSVVASWTHALVSDTDTFVATYQPVVSSPAVQQALTTRLTDAVITQLGLGDNILTRTLVTRAVTEAAGSDAFATATTASLRLAHSELAAQLKGETGRLDITDGVIRLPYAPFVDAITQRLTDAGVPFLDRLPEVTGGFTLATIDPRILPLAQSGYRVLDGLCGWLPWLTALLAAATLWVWPGARGPLIGLGLAALGWAAVLLVGWRVAMGLLEGTLAPDLAAVAGTVASVTAAPVASPLLAIGVTGAVLAFFAALARPSTRPL